LTQSQRAAIRKKSRAGLGVYAKFIDAGRCLGPRE